MTKKEHPAPLPLIVEVFEQEATAIDGKVNTMSAQIEQTPSPLSSATGAAPTLQTGASHDPRMLYIDNLRVLLISMVIVVHLAVTYGAVGSWYYHDPTNLPTAIILTFISGPGMASGMGIFFLIAGYFTPGSYDRKGSKSFLQDRLVRLGIPLLIYDLLLDPLVVNIASGLQGSYWRFYGNYLLHEKGIANGPVWFIAVLLLFSLVYAVQASNIYDRRGMEIARLSSDLWLHHRARSGELCSAHLVASRLDFPAAKRACWLSSPIYQLLHSGSDCLSE
ncbi:MAG: acyltransferase family protein [Ktedonobacteraceae bacterium]